MPSLPLLLLSFLLHVLVISAVSHKDYSDLLWHANSDFYFLLRIRRRIQRPHPLPPTPPQNPLLLPRHGTGVIPNVGSRGPSVVALRANMDALLHQVIEAQVIVYRCKTSVSMKEEEYPSYPAAVNDCRLHQHVERIGHLMLGPDKVKIRKKIMASEDFAFYLQRIPGVMFGIGMANDKSGAIHPASPLISLLMRMSFL